MQDKEVIQTYVNNFRKLFSDYLTSGTGMACNIFPSGDQGAILEFSLGPGLTNNDNYLQVAKLNESLSKIKQSGFGGDLANIHFAGTNIVLQNNKIILIKGEDSKTEWDEHKTKEDVGQIVHSLKLE